ncbi:MAG: hypothetical protein IJ573_06830 [Clostridia bacterium]|nr:hypothetical protein [Clostridia bacterium]
MAERITRVLARCILAVMGALLLGLAVCSLFLTCAVDSSVTSETVRLGSAGYTGIFASVLTLLLQLGLVRFFGRYRHKASLVCMLLWSTTCLIFVLGIGIQQRYDYEAVTEASRLFALGNYKMMHADYLNAVSYQLGIILPMEILARLFPRLSLNLLMQAANVLFTLSITALLLLLCSRFFPKDDCVPAAMTLTAGCIPLMLNSVFVYSTLPMLLLILGSSLCFSNALRSSLRQCFFCALLAGAACAIKPNAYIYLVALTICSLLSLPVLRSPWLLILPLFALIVGFGLSQGTVRQYELRSGVQLRPNVSTRARLVMGMQQGPAAGWYNLYIERYFPADVTPAQQTEQVSQDLQTQLHAFASDPASILRFYKEKLLTQTLDPTYGTIRYGQVCEHAGPLPALYHAVYNPQSPLHRLLLLLMKGWQCIFLFMAATGLLVSLHGKSNPDQVLLPLTSMGGLLYHMIFEAKSHYMLVYTILLLPWAALGLTLLVRHTRKRNTAKSA